MHIYLANCMKMKLISKYFLQEATRYIKNIEKKFGPVHLPSTFIKPSIEKLDTILDEIIPGFRNERIRPIVSEEKDQTFENNSNGNDHDIDCDTPNIDNLNLANESNKADSTSTNIRTRLPINLTFIDKLRAYQQQMKSAFELQCAEIIELKKENERLKSELAQAKCNKDFVG